MGIKDVWRKTPPSFLKHVNDNEIKIEQIANRANGR